VRFLKIVILLLLSTFFIGCSHQAPIKYNSAYNALLHKIHASGVIITKNDKTVIFEIPRRILFNHDSANFKTGAYGVLEFILDFSNYCDIDEISIAVCGKNRPIMNARARKIGEYLWRARVNTNFMYSYADNYKDDYKDDCIIIKYSLR